MAFASGFNAIRIIQSVGEADGEPGVALCQKLEQTGIITRDVDAAVYQVFDREDLKRILTQILHSDIKKGKTPIVHFEVHGSPDGFGLRDGSFIPWSDFGQGLAVLNPATKFNLLVVFACCEGFMQIDAVGREHLAPFTALLGCTGTVTTTELLDGLVAFYRVMLEEGKGAKALAALRNAVKRPGPTFGFLTCEEIFASVCLEIYLERQRPDYLAKEKNLLKIKEEAHRALSGNVASLSAAELEQAFDRTLDKELENFHATFFATDLLPENKERFNFGRLAAAAREEALRRLAGQ